MGSIRVLLIGDRLLCDLLTTQLAYRPETAIVGSCRSDEGWAGSAAGQAVDVVVLDLGSSPPTWPSTISEFRERRPGGRVVTLAGGRDDTSAVTAARAGAAGWLLAGSGLATLVDAVVAVHRGAAVYPPRQLAGVLDALRADVAHAGRSSGCFTSLTARELEVLRGLVEGYAARDLAEHLGLALNTVRTHTNRIFRKLGVHDRLEAVRLARAEGLAPTGAAERPHVVRPPVAVGDRRTFDTGFASTRPAR